MKLTAAQAYALRDLLATTAIFSAGDRLAYRYNLTMPGGAEQAEAKAVETLKTLVELNAQLKEYLA